VGYALDEGGNAEYEATAQVLVEFDQDEGLATTGGSPQDFATELVLVQGQEVRDRFEERLGRAVDVQTSARESSLIIDVTATSTNPELAAAAANAYAQAYVELRDEQATSEVASATEAVDQELAEVNASLAEVEEQILDAPFSEVLGARRDALIQQQISAQQTRNELARDAGRGGVAQIASSAEVPDEPAEPDPPRSALIAGLLATLVSAVLVVVLDRFDDAIDSVDDLEAVLGEDASVLGEVPELEAVKGGDAGASSLVSLRDANAPSAEAYRSLRTTLHFVAGSKAMRTLLVTSSVPQEGKTTTAANLAVAFAQAGKRVVALDADLRRPRLDLELLGHDAGRGVSDLLAGDCALPDVAHPMPGVAELVVIGAGTSVPNPAELLTGSAFADLLSALAGQADLVIIDTSPLLLVSDPLVLTGRVDAVLLVVRSRWSTQRGARHALDVLLQVDAPLVGAVLNGSRGERSRYGDHRYGYGYRPVPDTAPKGRRRKREGLPADG
jgi:capsular exopolysaccharide synthesis family protein